MPFRNIPSGPATHHVCYGRGMSGNSGNSSIAVAILVSALTAAVVTVATQVLVHRYGGVAGLVASAAPAPAPAAAPVKALRVPQIVGLGRAGADEVLSDRGLRLQLVSERADVAAAKGVVLEQTPLAGSSALPGEAVEVVLSSGPAAVQVPVVIGQPLAAARAAIEALGLKLGPVKQGGSGEAGTVVEVVPAAGQVVMPGQFVVLTVAPEGLQVPDLSGEHVQKAKAALRDLGLKVGRVRERYDPNRRAYLVLSQDPDPGSKVEPGTRVHLVINEGD